MYVLVWVEYLAKAARWRSQAKLARLRADARRVDFFVSIRQFIMLVWWNGRRVGLKIRCWRQHVGSSPTTSTNVPRVLPEAFFCFCGSEAVVFG